jgi:hypothetical protein
MVTRNSYVVSSLTKRYLKMYRLLYAKEDKAFIDKLPFKNKRQIKEVIERIEKIQKSANI